jgi:hypothetical protein
MVVYVDMQRFEETPSYQIEMGVDGDDHTVAVQPPVDITFREQMYDELDELGILKETIVRGGSFFETKHLPHGAPYSELRIPSTALAVAGQKISSIAHLTADVLRKLDRTAQVSPYLVAAGGTRRYFENVGVRQEWHG